MTDTATPLHLIKLCVGAESLADIRDWHLRRSFDWQGQRAVRHVTRNFPKRAAELLQGGSLYWIVKGRIIARNSIIGFEEAQTESGKPGCAIILGVPLTPTEPRAHRPFQGWRYFDAANAPADLPPGTDADDLPEALLGELKDLGLL